MMTNRPLGKPLFAALALWAVPLTPALAGEIKLTMRSSGLVLEGEFRGFMGDAYVVSTNDAAGEDFVIHVPANLVICEGSDCLDFLQLGGG